MRASQTRLNQSGMPAPAIAGHSAIAEVIDRIDVYKDRLAVRLRSQESSVTIKPGDDIESTDNHLLSIPWQKPPFKRFRQILLPHGSSRKEGGRSGRNDASDWSAPSHEADAGWTRLSQDPPLALSRLRRASDAAPVMST